mmetsp:Transcript_129237/g.227617  ORF Transcript_129237/g.227617 Transcript_129237/m.227617 type:complete len:710 (-) Transcript_129237:152-2281(-)
MERVTFLVCMLYILRLRGADSSESGAGECTSGEGMACADPMELLQRHIQVDENLVDEVVDELFDEKAHVMGLANIETNVADDKTSVDSVENSKSGWLFMPAGTSLNRNAFTVASYAGKDKQVYVDMIAMLGLTLQEQLPEAQRVCIVVKGMPDEYQNVLKGAGWTLVEVEAWRPNNVTGDPTDYWSEVYNKVDFWRLPFDQVLALDADTTLMRGDLVRELLQSTKVPRGQIGMVKDCCSNNFNSGVMLLQPDLGTHESIVSLMQSRSGDAALDQPIINEVYSNKIYPLPASFNVHGYSDICSEAAIVHFTGSKKPTTPEVDFLQQIHSGDIRAITGFPCPSLYVKFFPKLKEKSKYLTQLLQSALTKVDNYNLNQDPPPRCLNVPATGDTPASLLQVGADRGPQNIDVFDGIYKNRIWGGDGVQSSLSGGGSREEAIQVPCQMIHWLVHKVAAGATQLSDISFADATRKPRRKRRRRRRRNRRGSSMSFVSAEILSEKTAVNDQPANAIPLSSSFKPSWALPRTPAEIHLLDAAMGDFFWMPKCLASLAMSIPQGVKVNYFGVDVAPTAVALAEQKRAQLQAAIDVLAPGRLTIAPFAQKDLTAPQALVKVCGDAPCDIIFCNDALMHNPHAGIRKIVNNFNNAGAHFFVTNSYRNGSSEDIEAGQWRALDLDKSPYGAEAGMVPMCGEESIEDGGKREFMYAFRMPVQ